MGLYDRLGLKPSGAAPHLNFDTKALSSYFTNLPTYYIDNMSAQLRQSTLSFHQSGRIDANRPGPKPKALITLSSTASNTLIFGQKRRCKVGGVNERQAIEAFRSSREHQAAGEPDSDDSELFIPMETIDPDLN